MMHDRRRSVRERRRTTRMPLTVAVIQRIGRTTHLAQATNIAASGMTLRYVGDGTGYLPKTPVILSFQLPGGDDLIRLRGEVVFDRFDGPYHTAGLRFLSVSPKYARQINRFIASYRIAEEVELNL